MASPRRILVVGWLVFLIYAFPGYMSWDATTQLAQARRDHFTDDHPPAMALAWRVLEHVVHGPAPLLVIVSLAFLWGVHALLARYLAPRPAAIAAVLVLWFPPIGTVMAAIFKDTLMAAMLAAGVALLLDDRKRWLGLAVVGAATLFRYNAIAATLPFVVLLFRPSAANGVRRYALAIAAWLGITVAALATTRALADEETHYWYWSNAVMDIAGTLEYARDYSDAELEEVFAGVPLRAHDHIQARFRAVFEPVDFRHVTRGPHRVMDEAATADERSAVARAWWRLVRDNFGAYLEYRWGTFSALMRFDHAEYVNAYVRFSAFGHDEGDFVGHDAAPSKIQRVMQDAMIAVSRTSLFDPAPYFILAILLLPFALRDRVAAALLLSGIAYQLSYFPLAPTADYRYSQWMVTTTVLAAIVLFARRYRRHAIVT
jgi:hypothetical protein